MYVGPFSKTCSLFETYQLLNTQFTFYLLGAESFSKRDIPEQSERLNGIGECCPTSDWSTMPGMDQWCRANCKTGTNYASCPATHCYCPAEDAGNAAKAFGTNTFLLKSNRTFLQDEWFVVVVIDKILYYPSYESGVLRAALSLYKNINGLNSASQ